MNLQSLTFNVTAAMQLLSNDIAKMTIDKKTAKTVSMSYSRYTNIVLCSNDTAKAVMIYDIASKTVSVHVSDKDFSETIKSTSLPEVYAMKINALIPGATLVTPELSGKIDQAFKMSVNDYEITNCSIEQCYLNWLARQ
jgi:hypothetical protein